MAMPACPPGCTCGKHKAKPNSGKKCLPGCTCGRHQHKLEPKTRKKISESLIKHYRERGYVGAEFGKRCNRCHQFKPVGDDGDFYRKTKVRLKSGVDRQYWDSLCKPCRIEYNTEKLRSKTPEERSKMWREQRERWIAKHGEDEIRRIERERKAIYRDKKGLPPSSRPRISEDDIRVARRPIMDFVAGEIERRGLLKSEVAVKAGIDGSRLDRLLSGWEVVKKRNTDNPQYKTKKKWRKDGTRKKKITEVHLGVVDQLLTALDAEYMLTILYPE